MNFVLEQSNQLLFPSGGLALVAMLFNQTHLAKRIKNSSLKPIGNRKPSKTSNPQIGNADVLKTYMGLIAQGKTDYESIDLYREDTVFQTLLNTMTVPSAETLRQRLDSAPDSWNQILTEESLSLLRQHDVGLSPCVRDLIPLDIDVSPFDNSQTKKEGVSRTYKGMDGYAPIFAYLGDGEGYLVGLELREGKRHSQCDQGAFIRDAIRNAKRLTDRLLVRLDSGHDSKDTVEICLDEKVDFIIKRNLRREDPQEYLNYALSDPSCKQFSSRDGKISYRGSMNKELILSTGKTVSVRMVYEVVERFWDASGQMLLEHDVEVSCYYTSLTDDEDTVIRLYEEHGTSEQYHSELKTDLDLERFPSGKFSTNALILHIGMFVYNALRLIGQQGLDSGYYPLKKKKRQKRLRIKTVMQNLITIAVKLVSHARRLRLVFGKHSRFFKVYQYLYGILRC